MEQRAEKDPPPHPVAGPISRQQTLAAPGRGLVAHGPLLIATPQSPPTAEADLPVQHRFLFRLPGEERLLNATIVVDLLPPPGDGWAVFRIAATGVHVALKIEA